MSEQVLKVIEELLAVVKRAGEQTQADFALAPPLEGGADE